MTERVTVRITGAEIEALLAALPRCHECGARGEIIIDGRLLCLVHAGARRTGRAASPTWCDAADILAEALLKR
ncbi:MAG: hypothetical protein ABJB12_03810 [Pseudomonadota bacterium]